MKLLICLAFHYNIDNIKFLYKVIDNILDTYKCETDIIIDTNTEETINVLKKYTNIKIYVHNLEHPFHLTYMHRQHFVNNINNYDVVLYSEDDVLIPFESIINFMIKIYTMWPKYIPSFKRCEFSSERQKYALIDVLGKQLLKKEEIIYINDKRYFTPKYPNFGYQAFWILPTNLLKENINNNFLMLTTHREHAASYTLGPGHFHCYDENYKGDLFLNKIPLLQLNDDSQIDNICFAYHTPNKYVDVQKTPAIDEMIILQ